MTKVTLPTNKQPAPSMHRWIGTVMLALLAMPVAASWANTGGIEVDVVYTGELWESVAGGQEEGSAYLDNLDVTIDVDVEELWGLRGTRFFLYGLYNNGGHLSSTLVGDLQGVSNIETGVSAVRLYEAWLNVSLSPRSGLRVGLYDLNSEFDSLEASQLFVHSAHGIGTDISQTGANGPSIFPSTSLSLRYRRQLTDAWTANIAILDGVPGDPDDPGSSRIRLSSEEGALVIGELQRESARSRLLVGAWAYTEEVDIEPPEVGPGDSRERNWGAYLRGEATLSDRRGTLSAFGRFGIANDDVNLFESFFSAGLHWSGFLENRPGDEAGVAIAWAHASEHAGTTTDASEIALELTYRWQINDWLSLQPDIQYIINPGLDPGLENALVAGLRFEVQLL